MWPGIAKWGLPIQFLRIFSFSQTTGKSNSLNGIGQFIDFSLMPKSQNAKQKWRSILRLKRYFDFQSCLTQKRTYGVESSLCHTCSRNVVSLCFVWPGCAYVLYTFPPKSRQRRLLSCPFILSVKKGHKVLRAKSDVTFDRAYLIQSVGVYTKQKVGLNKWLKNFKEICSDVANCLLTKMT
jgi:hypothetical protein